MGLILNSTNNLFQDNDDFRCEKKEEKSTK